MNKVAIDCEMVGDRNNQAILAKIAIVDANLNPVYESFVQPTKPVGDYRNTGFTKSDLNNGKPFTTVQNEVRNKISGKLLVGHSVDGDLAVLDLTHPSGHIRDVAEHYKGPMGKKSLKDLAREVLGENIQTSTHHDPLEDARAAMKIYNKNPW